LKYVSVVILPLHNEAGDLSEGKATLDRKRLPAGKNFTKFWSANGTSSLFLLYLVDSIAV
jgi:hypothetical protein